MEEVYALSRPDVRRPGRSPPDVGTTSVPTRARRDLPPGPRGREPQRDAGRRAGRPRPRPRTSATLAQVLAGAPWQTRRPPPTPGPSLSLEADFSVQAHGSAFTALRFSSSRVAPSFPFHSLHPLAVRPSSASRGMLGEPKR